MLEWISLGLLILLLMGSLWQLGVEGFVSMVLSQLVLIASTTTTHTTTHDHEHHHELGCCTRLVNSRGAWGVAEIGGRAAMMYALSFVLATTVAAINQAVHWGRRRRGLYQSRSGSSSFKRLVG